MGSTVMLLALTSSAWAVTVDVTSTGTIIRCENNMEQVHGIPVYGYQSASQADHEDGVELLATEAGRRRRSRRRRTFWYNNPPISFSELRLLLVLVYKDTG